MTDEMLPPEDRDDPFDAPTPREQRIEAMVRSLPPASFDPEFRERLHDQFAGSTVVPAAPAAAPSPGRAGSGARRPGRARGRSILALAGAVVAGIAVFALLRSTEPAHETVAIEAPPPAAYGATPGEPADDGVLLVDGRSIAVADLRAGRAHILEGQRVELRGSLPLELVLDDVLTLELVPGSQCTLPGRAGPVRAEGAAMHGHIEQGEIRIVTGPGFLGRTLTLDSDEASVQVVGTTFAVIRDSIGTCVCVEDGVTQIRSRDGAQGGRVVAGRRLQLFDDSSPPVENPLRPGEAMKLGMLRDRARERLAP